MHNSIGYRPTWAEINLNNLKHNLLEIKSIIPGYVKVMACVKADAYGHGLIPVAKKLEASAVDYLSVASIDEGILLREKGIKSPILILGVPLKGDIAPILKYNLSQTLCDYDFARALNKAAFLKSRKVKVHVKVDTGMGRLGVLCKQAYDFVCRLKRLSQLEIEGIFTHLSLADVNRDFTLHQARTFEALIRRLEHSKINIPLVHAANSMGIAAYKQSHFNMVRPGLVLYGLYPDENLSINLKPVLSLKSKIVYAKRVPKGYGISYGYTYVTDKNSTIVNLPIGYGDGYPRNLSNLAPVLIGGRKFKISGRICMDQIMVDVGNATVKIGEEVVFIGSQGKNTITTEELANLSGTIPYEIVCGLGSRIPRVYI
ncbi:MAG: alanine racemase [Candidatus Omnitrophica bacterium]|jgi:alanine racemase|nr:alanine racemase [Candidatus Omnitrophota bacterium]